MRTPAPTRYGLALLVMLLAALPACRPVPEPTITPTAVSITTSPSPPQRDTPSPTVPAPATVLAATPLLATPVGAEPPSRDPHTLISRERLLATLADLTAIQPYSGWRNSASSGEAEARSYVVRELEALAALGSAGLEIEEEAFNVFLGTEFWESRLVLRAGGREVAVPASGLRGPRDDIAQALRYDSDGRLNDDTRDPKVVDGDVQVVRSPETIAALEPADIRGRLVFLDYAVIDAIVQGGQTAAGYAWELIDKGPAGLVLVTQNSHAIGESHGSFVGDVSVLDYVEAQPAPPVLYVRLEDLAPAGIESWDDLAQVESAQLTWDADVFSPALAGNVVAHIPGADPSRAMILSAHIDSPNSPGALDDGSGSAILLEIARVLDTARLQPPTDVYLVWFGGHETGVYGSYHFASTHQELLDRTLGVLQTDCLTRPLDGIDAQITLVTWPYGRFGDERLLWPEYLTTLASRLGIQVVPEGRYALESDNTAFAGYDVPNANMIYLNTEAMEAAGEVHYAGHLHDPYDTLELAREVASVLEDMAHAALAAALERGTTLAELRVSPPAARRAVFVASHTESVHMSPATFSELGMALAMSGYDVDLVPYGQPVTPDDLAGAALVVVLPVLDYPSPDGDVAQYDDAWSGAELDALDAYVANGGFLLLTNSARRLKYGNRVLPDENEDWADMNALAERFGVRYTAPAPELAGAPPAGSESTLVAGIDELALAEGDAVAFEFISGELLFAAGDIPVAALLAHGSAGGEVLALADVGILGATWDEPVNLPFWRNLGVYAAAR